MTKNEVYACLYLLNQEIRKKAKDVDYSICFDSNYWPIAMDDMEREAVYGGLKVHEYGTERMVKIANAITCGVTNMKTFEVYVLGEYIRKNHGCFLKRKKNGELFAPKGKGKRKKPVYNPIDIESIGQLEGIEFYKPERLYDQVGALKAESEKVVSVLDIDSEQKNHLYKLVCDGVVGIHIYLHLWRLNDHFKINIDTVEDEEYKKFLKMVKFLDESGVELNSVFYRL